MKEEIRGSSSAIKIRLTASTPRCPSKRPPDLLLVIAVAIPAGTLLLQRRFRPKLHGRRGCERLHGQWPSRAQCQSRLCRCCPLEQTCRIPAAGLPAVFLNQCPAPTAVAHPHKSLCRDESPDLWWCAVWH